MGLGRVGSGVEGVFDQDQVRCPTLEYRLS